MTAGIVGLGLIGGSLAKAYHEAGERVLAHDIDRDVLSFAVISGAVDEALTDETMAECDVILLAVRPAAAVEWLKNHAAKIDKHTVVIDCCGTKRKVCAACFPIAEQYGIRTLAVTQWQARSSRASSTPRRTSSWARRWCSCRRALTTLNYSAM